MTDSKTELTLVGADILKTLGNANQIFNARFPGESEERQPVHTVYGGAQLYKAETTGKLGELAERGLGAYAEDGFEFATALGMSGSEDLPSDVAARQALQNLFAEDPAALRAKNNGAWLALTVFERVKTKLAKEAVEDFRIDFEDGYGNRPDDEEDADAARTGKEVARGIADGLLPPFIGIRIKPLTEEHKARSIRTLDVFVSALVEESDGKLPENFVVTLPKVTIPEQVTALVQLFGLLEKKLSMPAGALKMEIMVETTQSIIDGDGRANLPLLFEAGKERITGAHFGTYDYTASANLTAAYQTMDNPVCDKARNMMMWAYGGRGIFLSDGATNVMPVGPHRAAKGESLTDAQAAENRAVVHGAWRLAYDHTRHSLESGFYQGWDLHPAQLPVRYAACYAFFLEGLAHASERLTNFIAMAAKATLVGDVFDDAATGQGLLNYFLRALNSGAISLDEVTETGLTVEEIQLRSFSKILASRTKRLAK